MNKGRLHARTNCRCGAKRQIVRSREGGFVTANCVHGHHPSRFGLDELPVVQCAKCAGTMSACMRYKNYGYECTNCEHGLDVADIVEEWWERFPERPTGTVGFG
jgi:hypothetical protein